ncbi:MAG: fimbria/pilus periplasmic chaperone [Thiobacillus sp.]
MRATSLSFQFIFASLVLLGLPGAAGASSLGISPTRVTLTEKTPTAAITVVNQGTDLKVIQTELLRWTQEGGKDVHAPTRDLLANPPVFTVAPGKTQVIRVGLNRASSDTQELAYRLFLQEVSPPPLPGFTGLQVALRIGVPVFVVPAKAPVSSMLRWKAVRMEAGTIQLTVSNEGNVHAELAEVMLSQPGNGSAPKVINWYKAPFPLLPGQSRTLVLKPEFDWKGDRLYLSARASQGAVVETELELENTAQR